MVQCSDLLLLSSAWTNLSPNISTGWAYSAVSFAVSIPLFYRLDEQLIDGSLSEGGYSMFQTVVEALGAGMLILMLLDVCRLLGGKELRVGSTSSYQLS